MNVKRRQHLKQDAHCHVTVADAIKRHDAAKKFQNESARERLA